MFNEPTHLDVYYEAIRSLPEMDPMRITASAASPLALAMHRDKDIVAYPHMRYLDVRLVALCDMQLYPDGPGPPPDVYIWEIEGEGDFSLVGTGYECVISDVVYDADEVLYLRPGHVAPQPEDTPLEHQVTTNLAIALPPRHGKSLLVTDNMPLWFLLRYPLNSVTVSTYSQDFADKWGTSLQDKMPQDIHKLPMAADGLPMVPRSSTMANMSFRPGKDTGEINFRGVGKALTGTGWGLGIIDDPFKDHTDALSEAIRNSRGNWYSSVFSNRTTRRRGCPPPIRVVMFTRWHEDDLAGRFAYKEDGTTPRDDWHTVRLPAIAEANDPLGRKEGASLCPQITPLSQLLTERKNSPTWFSCLYQGVPTHAKGGMIAKTMEHEEGENTYHHWVHTTGGGYTHLGKVVQGEHLMYFVMVDLAASLKTRADWSVASLWCWDSNKHILVLIDRIRDRVSTESHRDWLVKFVKGRKEHISFVGIENKTFGTNLINELQAKTPGFLIIPIPADKDKITRAMPYADAIKAGNVWFPHPDSISWSVTWENEHVGFPTANHDDQVDTGSMAWDKGQEYTHIALPAESSQQRQTPREREIAELVDGPSDRSNPYASLLGAIR